MEHSNKKERDIVIVSHVGAGRTTSLAQKIASLESENTPIVVFDNVQSTIKEISEKEPIAYISRFNGTTEIPYSDYRSGRQKRNERRKNKNK